MPELRTDWLTGRSVLVAENRALRPNEFAKSPGEPAPGEAASPGLSVSKPAAVSSAPTRSNCPFCAGNESSTPPAVYQQLDAQGRWRIRVVPNMFPAVESERLVDCVPAAEAASPGAASPGEALQRVLPAGGVHEVIIECARHADRMAALSVEELRAVLECYTQRLRHWRDDVRLRYGLLFKNQGPRAGASLAHLHSQLVALPFIPPTAEAEIVRADHVFQQKKLCAYCDIVARERSAGTRIVSDRDGFVAFCPFASWQPHEVWLLPTDHEPSFERASSATLDQLAVLLQQLFAQLDAVTGRIDFNLLLRTAPLRGEYDGSCHWRMEILPRANALAGWEVATGNHINPLPPERAAQQLRRR